MHYDVIIIGAGAAGLMCALQAGKRGKKVLVLDKAMVAAEKIRISGGGRCNFTNLHTSPDKFVSKNPNFCISALKNYTPQNFIEMLKQHKISYHEKTLGQLFCDNSSKDIINMLLDECMRAGVIIKLNNNITKIAKDGELFQVTAQDTKQHNFSTTSLVIATGGLSIPKIGASDFGYKIAKQFGLNIIKQEPALVPFIFSAEDLHKYQQLRGVSLDIAASYQKQSFLEAMLFTHKGLSGPAILQTSLYWQEGQPITLNLIRNCNFTFILNTKKQESGKIKLSNFLARFLPKSLATVICEQLNLDCNIADLSKAQITALSNYLHRLQIIPSGTEGYKTAEVTRGGVDTDELNPKSCEARNIKNLYFIGEVVDVTGWLGGYNFQWAWSSAYVCARALR